MLDILKNYDLMLHITEPTRGKSSLDLIISNIDDAKGLIMELWLSKVMALQGCGRA